MSVSDKNWKNKALHFEQDEDHFVLREGHEINVSELEVGDQIITSWSHHTGAILKTSAVKSIDHCESGSGMNLHVNRSNCYDSRSKVWVK